MGVERAVKSPRKKKRTKSEKKKKEMARELFDDADGLSVGEVDAACFVASDSVRAG